MRCTKINKKETRVFKDILIILTSVSIFMLATVLESCSYETVDVFSSSQDNDSVPASDDNMPSPKSPRSETTTATLTSSASTSTVRSWPSHEFFENVLGKSGIDVEPEIIPTPTPESTLASTEGSVTEINNLTTTFRNVTMRYKENQFNNSLLITTRQTPIEIQYENYTSNEDSNTRPLNMTDDRTRSQLSRDWKLGFDISIVEAENTSKTNNNYFHTEALHTREEISRAPSSVVTKAEIPLTIRITSHRNKTLPKNQTNLQPNLYAKVSGSHNFGSDGKTVWEIRNKTTVHKIKKSPLADYVDDENSNPYGWIDEIGDTTSAPLSNVPKFSVVTWPYTKKSTSRTTAFPFSIYRPKGNITRKITPRPTIIRTSTTRKTTPTPEVHTAKPMHEGPTTTWTQIPVLIVENKQKDKITTQHWGSSGTKAPIIPPKQIITTKPFRINSRTTTTYRPPSTSLPTPTEFLEEEDNPENENNPADDFVESLFSVVSENPEIAQVMTTRAPTNIWYKPIINHYSISNISTTYAPPSTLTTTPQYNDSSFSSENIQQPSVKNDEIAIIVKPVTTEATTSKPTPKSNLKYKIKTAHSKEKVIIFKIWNYLNGKLELQTQREIPSWILNNYDIQDGQVLNLKQLPPEIKDLVKSTIQNVGSDGKVENRTEREQFHWQELPSVSPEVEISQGDSGEKRIPTFPSWITDVSTEWKKPISLNYVVLNSTRIPSYILNHGTSSEETNSNYQQYLQEYLQYVTTPSPPTSKAPESSVEYVTRLKNQQNLNRLQQLIIDFMATTPVPIVKDSHPWDKIQDHDLMANLASFAIIMTHLRNQYPDQNIPNIYSPPSTTPNPYGFTPPARDHFWAAMYPLLQHLLNNKNFTFIPPPASQSNQNPSFLPVYYNSLPPVKYPPTGKPFQSLSINEATRYNDQEYTSTPTTNTDTEKDSGDDSESDSDDDEYDTINDETLSDKTGLTKTLLTKAVKGIKAIKAIKALKKGLKKAKKGKKGKKGGQQAQYQFFNPSKLGFIKPGTYDFQFDIFDGGFVDIIKKKLTALVAIKYMPVALVLAFGLLPLGIVFIPFLFKYLKLKLATKSKKQPKHHHHRPIYVPVPYPEYVPVAQPYPAPYPVYHTNHHSHGHGWPSNPYGAAYDNYYAGDNTGYNEDVEELKGDKEEIDHHYLDHAEGGEWSADTAQQSANPQYADSYNNEPADDTLGNKGYQLGYDVGSKLGKLKLALPIPESLDNNHDTEVLKILINNKKDMIKKLLRKWKLTTAIASPFVPPYEETQESFDNTYDRKSRRRRRK